jgi:hypothetical protein
MKKLICLIFLTFSPFIIFSQQWNIINIPNVSKVMDVYFINPNTGWLAAQLNSNTLVIYQTNDKAVTWNQKNNGHEGFDVNYCKMDFVNENTGYIIAVGTYGKQ